MTLNSWIKTKGTAHVAKTLAVQENTVRFWRAYHCLPRAHQMREIVKATRGRVSYKEMIEDYFKKSGKKK